MISLCRCLAKQERALASHQARPYLRSGGRDKDCHKACLHVATIVFIKGSYSSQEPLPHCSWFTQLPLHQESESTPDPVAFVKSIAIHFAFLPRYFCKSATYTAKLYHNTAPSVSRYLAEALGSGVVRTPPIAGVSNPWVSCWAMWRCDNEDLAQPPAPDNRYPLISGVNPKHFKTSVLVSSLP